MKIIAVFMKSSSFCEKHCSFCEKQQFSWKALWFSPEKWKAQWKAPKTAGSTQISHLDLVFHRVQREGQLGNLIFWWYLVVHMCLVVHVCVHGAHICTFNCACMWCMYVHVVIYAHIWWCMYVHMVHVCVYGASVKNTPEKWKVHEAHLKSKSTWKVKSPWKANKKWKVPEKWKAHEKHTSKVKSTWKVKSTSKAHLKSKSTWKVKSTSKANEKWKAPEKWKAHKKNTSKVKVTEKWKAHEKQMKSKKHLKSGKHMKSTPQKWKKHLKSEKHRESTWKVKSLWKALKNEKHLKSEKYRESTWKAHLKGEKHLKSEKHIKSTPEKWNANENHLKSEKHMEGTSEKGKAHEMLTWKVKSTWLKSEKHMKSTPHRWKAHEKYLRSEKHMKSTWNTCAPHAFPLTRSKWEICVEFSCFCSQNFRWKALCFSRKAPLFERPLARNCNPMFYNLLDFHPSHPGGGSDCSHCNFTLQPFNFTSWGGGGSKLQSLQPHPSTLTSHPGGGPTAVTATSPFNFKSWLQWRVELQCSRNPPRMWIAEKVLLAPKPTHLVHCVKQLLLGYINRLNARVAVRRARTEIWLWQALTTLWTLYWVHSYSDLRLVKCTANSDKLLQIMMRLLM